MTSYAKKLKSSKGLLHLGKSLKRASARRDHTVELKIKKFWICSERVTQSKLFLKRNSKVNVF